MIVVWGSPDDAPVERVLEALAARGAEVCHADAQTLAAMRYDVAFAPRPSGWIDVRGRRIGIDEIGAIYLRPLDGASRSASAMLLALAVNLDGIVVNRPAAGRSNMSKPYQLGLIAAAGLAVPATLVTTDPAAAREFVRDHGRVVYKSISGIRSIVNTLDARDDARLDGVRTGPVQFQEYVEGLDVRVHVVGERWFGCSARSAAADYRYSARAGTAVELAAYDVPETMGRRLVALTRSMGLEVAGIDLRLRADGTWVCFEVNPSPGFPWYEDETGHPIADAIAELLAT